MTSPTPRPQNPRTQNPRTQNPRPQTLTPLALEHGVIVIAAAVLFGTTWFTLVAAILPYIVARAVGLSPRGDRCHRYAAIFENAAELICVFLFELVKASRRVAWLTFFKPKSPKSDFLTYATRLRSNAEVNLLANLITLTPGTISVHIAEDRKTLTIHALEAENKNAVRNDIRNAFEARIAKLFDIAEKPETKSPVKAKSPVKKRRTPS